MNTKMRIQAKKFLSKIIPNSGRLRYLAYLPKLEAFHKLYAKESQLFADRYKMYQYINNEVLNNQPISYLEFGVFEGESFRYWLNLNNNEASRFYGFDTFTGLPEDWIHPTATKSQGTFNVEGRLPEANDQRGNFVKGLFQETLPGYLAEHDSSKRLVIHNDSDLYSATLYVLTRANDIIAPGTIIIFDEYAAMLDEFRALEDYCCAYMRNYKVIAATQSPENYYFQVAIEML